MIVFRSIAQFPPVRPELCEPQAGVVAANASGLDQIDDGVGGTAEDGLGVRCVHRLASSPVPRSPEKSVVADRVAKSRSIGADILVALTKPITLGV